MTYLELTVISSPFTSAEHGVELQTLPLWYVDGIQGFLSGSVTANNPAGAIAPQFFTNTLVRQGAVRTMSNPPGAASGGADLWTVESRLFNALGSTLNDQVFVLADAELNCIKTGVSGYQTVTFSFTVHSLLV